MTATVDLSSPVSVMRHQIDALDVAISNLVLERAAISQRLQDHRVSSGGARVDIGREREVHENYRVLIGETHGSRFADAVLQLCKNNVY